MSKKDEIITNEYFDLLEEIKTHITNAQYQVLTAANVEKNILCWNIGKVILGYSTWGNKFVENLSKNLRMEYPGTQGYSVRNLNYMKQCASRIPTEEVLHRVAEKSTGGRSRLSSTRLKAQRNMSGMRSNVLRMVGRARF